MKSLCLWGWRGATSFSLSCALVAATAFHPSPAIAQSFCGPKATRFRAVWRGHGVYQLHREVWLRLLRPHPFLAHSESDQCECREQLDRNCNSQRQRALRGAVVSLTSTNTSVATVPSGVTVAAGNTSATFTVSATSVSQNANVTISGTYGGATESATLTVTAGRHH